jgi:preprotein translocase subunit SecG
MTTLLIIVHIVVCFLLIGIVLVQGGKGSEIGAAFGGSSQTLFGSRGAATFLGKMTTVVAVVFMITSLLLAVISVRRGSVGTAGVVEQKTTETAPAGPKGSIPEKAGVKPAETPNPQPPKQ